MNKTNVSYINVKSTAADNVTTVELLFGINLEKIPCVYGLENVGVDVKRIFEKYSSFVNVQGTMALFTVTGVAKCNAEDIEVMDSVVGYRIALSAAQKKAFNVAKRLYKDLFDETLKTFVEPLVDYKVGSQKAEINCANHKPEIVNTYYNF